ncbi:MAG: hypothetical protein P9L99_02785 [Candidatus Lernaella stagnicola]|nr:hypothetical protein [Candidatus Lernaella stagnicola]
MRRALWLVFIVLLLGAPVSAEDDTLTSTPPKTDFFQFTYSNEVWRDPALDPLANSLIAPGPTRYSNFYGRWVSGDHRIDFGGGLTGFTDRYAYGEMMDGSAFTGSIAYRYHGLFGGVIRPVARFTAGAGQDYRQVGGPGFVGYGSSGTAFFASEAGLEIVYKGIGIGVTEAYVVTQRYDFFDPAADVTGPAVFNPTPDWGNWSEWLTNFYLIVE